MGPQYAITWFHHIVSLAAWPVALFSKYYSRADGASRRTCVCVWGGGRMVGVVDCERFCPVGSGINDRFVTTICIVSSEQQHSQLNVLYLDPHGRGCPAWVGGWVGRSSLHPLCCGVPNARGRALPPWLALSQLLYCFCWGRCADLLAALKESDAPAQYVLGRTDGRTDGQTDGQTDRQTERQAGRQAGRRGTARRGAARAHAHTHTHTHTHPHLRRTPVSQKKQVLHRAPHREQYVAELGQQRAR
eukprot:gene25641-biopygen21007